jgi:hypothetical protein
MKRIKPAPEPAMPPLDEIHTITITTSGQHGGWDITVESMKERGHADWQIGEVTYRRSHMHDVVELLKPLLK